MYESAIRQGTLIIFTPATYLVAQPLILVKAFAPAHCVRRVPLLDFALSGCAIKQLGAQALTLLENF
jgi:hypothetical protein